MSPLDAEAPDSETPPVPTQPTVFVEVKDAGERINGAISIVANLVQPLTAIAGGLSGNADIFQIFISGDQPFSATTLSRETLLELPIDNTLGIPTDLLEDPQLFLFDALGNAVYGNDDLDTLGGFEIVASAADVNTAFVASNGALYTLNLQTGIATSLGAIGSGEAAIAPRLRGSPPWQKFGGCCPTVPSTDAPKAKRGCRSRPICAEPASTAPFEATR